jgi:large subunit ribosomal protein L13
MNKTYTVKQDDLKRENHIVDAKDKILGHVATEVAKLLMGKDKPLFDRNSDIGDMVTVINCEKIQVTGKKPQQKLYYWHSNFPGGFKNIPYEKLMLQHPDRIITFAVDGMLPHNHLHDKMMKRLKVFIGPVAGQNTVEEAVAVKATIKKAKIEKIHIKTTKERKQGKR